MGSSEGPKIGEGVWHHEYRNGVIRRFYYDDDSVDIEVLFYRRTMLIGPRIELFDSSSFEYFHPVFRQWMIYG